MSGATLDTDLIAAVATPPGQGGIGIVRLSGRGALDVVKQMCASQSPAFSPRVAAFCRLYYPQADEMAGELIDEGLVLWFNEGQSFTGEEVVELQVHGSPVVLQQILNCCCRLGARLARPGEFTERAFLNGRMDLAQAEAVADLIASASMAAARGAVRSLRGDFSRRVTDLAELLAKLRILVEACIDFPEEEVEHLEDARVKVQLLEQIEATSTLLKSSGQGQLMNEGAAVALLGAPNVGKSSLLNALTGEDAAIVTDIPGTTRDLLKVDLTLEGVPIRLVDTAGLRVTSDPVEQMGVERARSQAQQADLVVLMFAADEFAPGQTTEQIQDEINAGIRQARDAARVPERTPVLVVINKTDLYENTSSVNSVGDVPLCWISATRGDGVDELQNTLLQALGRDNREVPYTARARHVAALSGAREHLQTALQLLERQAASEFIAEELRSAHLLFGEIVGVVTPDELLGRIFSEFCIGK